MEIHIYSVRFFRGPAGLRTATLPLGLDHFRVAGATGWHLSQFLKFENRTNGCGVMDVFVFQSTSQENVYIFVFI